MRVSYLSSAAVVFTALELFGCAQPLNERQKRVYTSFEDCRTATGVDVWIERVDPDGRFYYRGGIHDTDRAMVEKCLRERHGFKFRGDPDFGKERGY